MTPTEIIFHHFDASPFSEKIRLAFGLKGLAWRSVRVSPIMPRPDLMPLTGGYRRTPTMQIGADIYCDTAVILAEIEARWPEPPLWPKGQEGVVSMLALWSDKTFFQNTVNLVFGAIRRPAFRRPSSRIAKNCAAALRHPEDEGGAAADARPVPRPCSADRNPAGGAGRRFAWPLQPRRRPRVHEHLVFSEPDRSERSADRRISAAKGVGRTPADHRPRRTLGNHLGRGARNRHGCDAPDSGGGRPKRSQRPQTRRPGQRNAQTTMAASP